jgi:predicted secreted protein
VTFKGYASIYTVDVAKNDYVPGEVYRSEAGNSGPVKSSSAVFAELQAKTAPSLAKYAPLAVSLTRTLFLRENEKKPPLEELKFRDYERVTGPDILYTVRL